MLDTRHIDCVILDLHMPQEDGFEVLMRMAAENRHVPVVVLTGHDSPEVRERLMQAGVSQYITKPVKRRVILHAIESTIARYETNSNG